ADAPQRIAIVEPITGVALTGRREQAFPLVITQRIGADIRQHGEACDRTLSQRGVPRPAARKTCSLIPRSVQHAANLPSMTTAGTERTPSALARLATSLSCMSSTITSQDGQAAAFTVSTASLQAGQPALNTSTFRLVAIFPSPSARSIRTSPASTGLSLMAR